MVQGRSQAGTAPIATGFAPNASMPGAPWHVAYTKPRAEQATTEKLQAEGAGVWCPMVVETMANRQKRHVLLFPRYVLLQLTGERVRWGHVIRNAGGEELASVITSPSGRALVVPDQAIAELVAQAGKDGIFRPPPAREISRRDHVRVLDGPFTSFSGIVNRTAKDRVWCLLSIFGRSSEVELKRSAVELVA